MSLTIYNKADEIIATIDVNDDSYHYKALCGDDYVLAEFELTEHIEIELLSYIIVDDERYTLLEPVSVTCVHSRRYEYVARFDAMQSLLKRYRFRNPVDGRITFPYTAKPEVHLQMLVDILRGIDSQWSIGSCVSGYEKTITYDGLTCFEALELMAQTFETEWEVVGGVISLHKVSYAKDAPIALAYGKGKGFVSGVSRKMFGTDMPIDTVYPQGGERNIDASKYGNSTLLLPAEQIIGYDGEFFEDDLLYDATQGVMYASDVKGQSVTSFDALLLPQSERSEGVLDCTEIYPQREGRVTDVILRGSPTLEHNFYDIVDSEIPSSLNYEAYRIAGEDMLMVFQTGMLAGKEFVVSSYVHDSLVDDYPSRRFTLETREYDGVMMPSVDYPPQVGDKYIIFGTRLPDDYVRNDANKSGASWDMMRKCVRFLHENQKPKYTFSGELDVIAVKNRGLRPKLKVGCWVDVRSDDYQPQSMLVRIVGVKDHLNNPYKIEIDISEQAMPPSSRIKLLASNVKISNAVVEQSMAIKRLSAANSSGGLERKVGILIGDDFDMSVRDIATEVANDVVTEIINTPV